MIAPSGTRFRFTLAYGVLLALLLVQVPLVIVMLRGAASQATAAGAPPGRLVARGPADSPQLIEVPNGQIGWWLSGTGADRRLTVALLDHGRLARLRSVGLAALAGPGGEITDTPVLAAGPGGQLLITWRTVIAKAHVAVLGIGMWNTDLAGQPALTLTGNVPLVSNSVANDLGPTEQYLSFDQATQSYLLVETDLRPWMAPNTITPNRPELLVSLIGSDGQLAQTNAIHLPAAGSFVYPTVRVLPSSHGHQLIVTTPSVGPYTRAGPDQVWLYRIDGEDKPAGAGIDLYSSGRFDQILDTATATGPHGTRLLVFELANAEQGGAQLKQLIGLAFDARGPRGAPFPITQAVDPGAQLPAQLLLSGTRHPGQFLLVWNEGSAGLFSTLTLSGAPARIRALFMVEHRLFMEPAVAMAYDRTTGQLEALWQDPGSASTPQDITAQAPVYLSAATVN